MVGASLILMVANPERRAQLADAGLRVLASAGTRGLTHRAVDREAEAPEGTAANYFRTRDELLGALGERVFERIAPDPERLEQLAARTPGIELATDYVRYIVERTAAAPDLMRALFELRIEATRRPGLAQILRATLTSGYRGDVDYNAQAGLPGGAKEIAMLHYALDGLLFDQLTTSIDAGFPLDEVVTELVHRILGPATTSGPS